MTDVAQQTFPLYDRILGGRLAQLLADWQAEDISVIEMTWRLRERDCFVSPMTVRRWLAKIEDES